MNSNIFVIPINMENRSVEAIAREAAIKINEVVEHVGKERAKEAVRNEKTRKCTKNLGDDTN